MTEEYKKRKKAYVREYQRKTYTTISFKVRTNDDSEIINFLKKVPNRSEYLKKLVLADMAK